MRTMLTFIVASFALTLSAQVAPKDWMPSARDVMNYHWATNPPVKLYKARVQASAIALPLAEETPAEDMLTLEWDPATNAAASGFILWMNSPTGAVRLLSTNTVRAAVPALAGIYYVSATNRVGSSALSLGLVWPKPVTNVLTFSSTESSWPALSWTNKPTAAWRQFFTVKYSGNQASVVFSSDVRAPFDTWQTFAPWLPVTTTNRNIQLYWKAVAL